MTYRSGDITTFALPLPIPQQAFEIADHFAERQPTPAKADQVRLNTLAVYVVHDYLQLMGLSTDLGNSDSWSPIGQLCADTADLAVTGAGKIECRPLLASDTPLEQQTCPIPPEVWEDRVGYVIVQIDESQHKAHLLGFVETAMTEELPLSQLHSPENLLDHLDRLLHPVTVREAVAQAAETRLTNLGRWLQNTFETGWQTVESLLNPSELQLAYRFRGDSETAADLETAIRRAKVINLGIQPVVQSLLVVEIISETAQETSICLQVYPSDRQYLPIGVRLAVLDDVGTIFLEATSRETDNYIQLRFSGNPGETFSVQVRLENSSITENFVI